MCILFLYFFIIDIIIAFTAREQELSKPLVFKAFVLPSYRIFIHETKLYNISSHFKSIAIKALSAHSHSIPSMGYTNIIHKNSIHQRIMIL